MNRLDSHHRPLCAALALLLALAPGVSAADPDRGTGMVAGAERAWVTSNGDVSGQPALWKIVLEGSLDPNVPGRSLLEGDQIRILFPPEFDLGHIDDAYPVADIPSFGDPTFCVPTNFQCTTGVLLAGWPEQPFFPPANFHTVSVDEADNAFVYTATRDILPNPPDHAGIKEIFILLNGIDNPKAGIYPVRVEAQTGPGGSWENGLAFFEVLRSPRPSVNATSVFVKALSGLLEGGPACGPGTLPPNPDNPVYQFTVVNEPAPFVWSFLLWGRNGRPLDDVRLDWISDRRARLIQGPRLVVGDLYIDAPRDAEGFDIQVNPLDCGTYLPAAPVIGGTPGVGPQPVGRLDLQFWAGTVPGVYTTTLSMRNGNSERMVVVVE